MESEGRASMTVAGPVWVKVGNWITRLMIQFHIGESRDGEPEPDPLGLGFASSGVGDGGSALWLGVADWSVIMRLAVPLVRGSTADDPPSFFFCCMGSSWCSHREWSGALWWPGQPPKIDL
jgi:hypothetical protein